MDAVNTDGLREELRALANRLYGDGDEYDAYRPIMEAIDRLAAVEAELEQTRVQLAGCGVLAMCNTRDSLEQQRGSPGDYGWSASLGDVMAATEREIEARERAEKAEAELAALRASVIAAHTGENIDGCGMTNDELARLLPDSGEVQPPHDDGEG